MSDPIGQPEPGTLAYYRQHRAEAMRRELELSEQAQAAENAPRVEHPHLKERPITGGERV